MRKNTYAVPTVDIWENSLQCRAYAIRGKSTATHLMQSCASKLVTAI